MTNRSLTCISTLIRSIFLIKIISNAALNNICCVPDEKETPKHRLYCFFIMYVLFSHNFLLKNKICCYDYFKVGR